jgi:hypothetical protein
VKTKRLLLFVGIFFVFAGRAEQSDIPAEREFQFSSGGSYHIEGYCEWTIKLDSDGNLAVTHNVQDGVTDFGSFALSAEENDTLWGLVDALGINELESSKRPGMPDEVQHTLALMENGSRHEVQIWIGEAREIEALVKLVTQIGNLIETYTGQQPVLN